MDFNRWLEEELNIRHLSIQTFSKKAGLARSTVSKIISGSRNVTAYTASNIAQGLNVTTNLVLERAGLLKSAKKTKIHPLFESAVEEISKLDNKKQILAAKLLRVITERKEKEKK